MKPVMCLAEVAQAMRSAGIPASAGTVADSIRSGAYPFGRVKKVGPTGRCTFEISRKKFNQWLEAEFGIKEAENSGQ